MSCFASHVPTSPSAVSLVLHTCPCQLHGAWLNAERAWRCNAAHTEGGVRVPPPCQGVAGVQRPAEPDTGARPCSPRYLAGHSAAPVVSQRPPSRRGRDERQPACPQCWRAGQPAAPVMHSVKAAWVPVFWCVLFCLIYTLSCRLRSCRLNHVLSCADMHVCTAC